MQLIVHVFGLGSDEDAARFELDTFRDQEKVAARIARAVRNWIRVVPVRNSGSRLDLRVTAEWLETQARKVHAADIDQDGELKPKRKRKARK